MAEEQVQTAVDVAKPKRFRVITRCNSRARTPFGETFKFVDKIAGTQLVGATLYETDQFGSRVPSWLQIEVECSAGDEAGAEAIAYQAVHQVVCLFSLVANAPVSLPLVYLAYEIRDDEAERMWEQRFHVERVGLASRLVNLDSVRALLDGIAGMDVEAAVKLGAALRWYRTAVATDDLLERFTMVWAGLETLNVLLQDRLHLNRYEESACPNCGHLIKRPSASGVHGWIEAKQGIDVRRKARKLRTALAHGIGTIADAATLVAEVGGKVERALVEAVLELTGAHLEPPEEPLAPDLVFVARLKGTLSGPVETAIVDEPAHPHVNGELMVKGSHNSGPDGGTVELDYELPGEKVVPKGVTLTVKQVEVPQETVG